MFKRGSGAGLEAGRIDESFYRGIVVKNNDPSRLNRVKVYIPEISNQPFEEWFDEFDEINVKIPGLNNDTDNWSDTKIFEEMCAIIPWAEPCYPLLGESGNARYSSEDELAVITDGNYSEGFEKNNDRIPALAALSAEPPPSASGSFAPAFLYENKSTTIGDGFFAPLNNYSVNCNPYAFQYKPDKFSNKTKGAIGIPEVGAKVWVFHYQGDLNFPVYFGVMQDFRSLTLVNNTTNEKLISNTYPSDFEN